MIRGLDPARAALVISECQRGVLDPDEAIFPGRADHAASRGTLAKIAALADAFRAEGLPVIHVHVAHRADFAGAIMNNPIVGRSRKEGRMVEGTDQVLPMPEVQPAPGDFVSTRRAGMGMWHGTDLDATLRNLRVETVVLTGVSTNLAMVAGAFGAVDLGYFAVIPEDATAGASPETHEWSLRNTLALLASITTSDAVVEAIGS
jgi:nicotinamidase-related amidase